MKRIRIPNRIPKEDRGCRIDKSLRFFYAVCIVCIAALCTGAFADVGGTIQEETVVSLVWEDSRTDVKKRSGMSDLFRFIRKTSECATERFMIMPALRFLT